MKLNGKGEPIPAEKTAEIDEFIKTNMGVDRVSCIKRGVCVPKPWGCGKLSGPFKNVLSKTEYTISGLCQKCQDRIFG